MGKWFLFAIACLGLGGIAYYFTQPQPTVERGFAPRSKLVETGLVRGITVQDEIEALGTLRANEEVTIVAESQGVITGINFDEGGQVEAGQKLVQLDDQEERALLASARAIAREAQRQFERLSELRQRNTVSQSSVDEQRAAVSTAQANVRVAEVRLAKRAVTAPFAGRIGLREVSPGDLLQVGSAVATLDDVSVLKIIFDVPEKYLSSLRVGLEVAGTSAAYPNEIFKGTIDRIDTRIDEITRTVDVRAIIPNDENKLKPGLSMTVKLLGEERPGVIVDDTAIVSFEDRQYVYVIDGDTVKQTRVEIGTRYDGYVEILSGVRPGQEVVAKGLQGLSDGLKIKRKTPAATDTAPGDTAAQTPAVGS